MILDQTYKSVFCCLFENKTFFKGKKLFTTSRVGTLRGCFKRNELEKATFVSNQTASAGNEHGRVIQTKRIDVTRDQPALTASNYNFSKQTAAFAPSQISNSLNLSVASPGLR